MCLRAMLDINASEILMLNPSQTVSLARQIAPVIMPLLMDPNLMHPRFWHTFTLSRYMTRSPQADYAHIRRTYILSRIQESKFSRNA